MYTELLKMAAMQSINPATGEIVREWPEHNKAEVRRRLNSLQQAFSKWSLVGLDKRSSVLRSLAARLRAEVDRHASLMTEEMGKPIREARAEVEKSAWACDYYAENLVAHLAPESIATDGRESGVEFVPLGIILGVMPWNFPYWQVLRFLAPALAAGNVVLLKHASNVCGCSGALEDLVVASAEDAGWQGEPLLRSVRIPARRVADLIDSPAIAAVTLTGSEAAGRSVAAAAGAALKKTVLELGGSDPCIVTKTADLERAVEVAALSRSINGGQSCIAAKRFLVEREVAAEFEERFVDALDRLKVGDPSDEETDIGPLARGEFVEELQDLVDRSLAMGAREVLAGGRVAGAGFFFRPVVLADVTADMPVWTEETFGPVAPVMAVADLDTAVDLANASRFGLGASVWTGDLKGDLEAVNRLQAGAVFVNGLVKSDPRLPFGGIKASGYGRELGSFGIREFVNPRTFWRG